MNATEGTDATTDEASDRTFDTAPFIIYAKLLGVFFNIAFIRPPGTVVPGGLMFCCGFFSFFLFCGTLRRYSSEMAQAIALKLSHMIASVHP